MNRCDKNCNEKGFTLIEVMISLVIFLMGALALFGMQMRAITATQQARMLETATEVSQFPIESLKGASFAEIDQIQKIQGNDIEYIATPDLSSDPDPIFTAGPQILKDLCNDWWRGYFLPPPPGANPNVQFGNSQGKLTLHFNQTAGINSSVDITVEVEWCDNGALADCKVGRKHKIGSKQKFMNDL